MDIMEVYPPIIGALAGFITAYLAQPIKDHFARKSLRNAIYREIGYLIYSWDQFLKTIDKGTTDPLSMIENIPTRVNQLNCYRFVKSQPLQFYALPEAATINNAYGNFLLIEEVATKLVQNIEDFDPIHSQEKGEDPADKVAEMHKQAELILRHYAPIAISTLFSYLKEGKLDTKTLLRLVPNDQKKLIQNKLELVNHD